MNEDFKQGEEVKSINLDMQIKLRKGFGGVEKITVNMEDGQMSGVPWFCVWKNGEVVDKYNGALIFSVEL